MKLSLVAMQVGVRFPLRALQVISSLSSNYFIGTLQEIHDNIPM